MVVSKPWTGTAFSSSPQATEGSDRSLSQLRHSVIILRGHGELVEKQSCKLSDALFISRVVMWLKDKEVDI